MTPDAKPLAAVRTCDIEGCEGEHAALGLCSKHYVRLRTHGDPNVVAAPRTRTKRACSVYGCSNTSNKRGWCTTHYERWRRHGDPLKGRQVSDPSTWASTSAALAEEFVTWW